MGRPRVYRESRVATAVRLPEPLYWRLRQAASDRDVSANLLVTKAVSEFLDRLPTAEAAMSDKVMATDLGATEVAP